MTSLPSSLRLIPSFAFVGRARELDLLGTLVPRAPGEGRRVALVVGEPGSGKSRLVRELAGRQAETGVQVLYGACDSTVRAPYRPVVEALDTLVRDACRDGSPDLRPETPGQLSRLLPGLTTARGIPASGVDADPDTERHRLHVAVTDLLATASRRSPLLIVLEDVHWADGPTLLLLRHLVRVGGDVRMLLLATYRDAEADAVEELSDVLVDVARTEGVGRVRLSGLSADEIADFVRRAAGADPGDRLVEALADLTDGNAFLLTELWRELRDTGSVTERDGILQLARPVDELGTPESVRAVVSQRLARLAPTTTAALETAAISGAAFELDTLRRAAWLEEGELLDAVDEAERSGLLVEVPARGLAYRFAHELVRRSVIDRLSATRRAELHLRVAEALERGRPGPDDRGRLAALAHHFAAAAPVGGRERAIAYNLLAASSATAALAFDEAAERLQTALALDIPDPAERAEAYLELGDVSHRGGRLVEALDAFERTAELARSLGDARLLARAAIGFEEACWRPGMHDGGSVQLLEEAAAALSEEDSELRSRLLGGLARALDFRGESSRAARARDESIRMARRCGDRRGLAWTLGASYWSRGVSTHEEINSMLAEALQIGEEIGDPSIRTEALAWLVPSYVSLGDHTAARDVLRRLFDAARDQNEPFHLHVAEHYASALALCDGDLAAAEAAAARSAEWSRLLTGRDASGVHGIQMFSIRREQGRLAELAPVVRVLAGRGGAAWGPGLVAVLAELGLTDEAKRELRRLALDELAEQRRSLWLAALTYLTDACSALGDAEVAERLYPELAPYRGSSVMIGHLVSCYGAADRYLGMLATAMGEWELAEEHFEAAGALNRELGARTWLAHTAYEHGRMLLLRGGDGDTARAGTLLEESVGLAQAIGMSGLVARAGALGTSPSPPSMPPDGLTSRELDILRLLAQGLSNRQIGRSLFISEHTAANHVRSILRKTGSANRTEAAAYAYRRRLVEA
jgi:DNA-binding CsgD family transcriptional regulator/tetratricopeptide (TPR) repeat protein